MTEVYQQKIVEAFRDNAIRSVLLIDDEYLSYKSSIDNKKEISAKIADLGNSYGQQNPELLQTKIQELVELNTDIQRSDVASNFVNFFHENKLICDVESNTNNLEHEKIRKSDLIVLDYYLQKDGIRAERSLKLLHQLSTSPHMNVVVVYTGESIPDVWLEIAATLRGSADPVDAKLLNDKKLKEEWDLESEDWQVAWNRYFSDPTKTDYFIGKKTIETLTQEFLVICDEQHLEKPNQLHVETLLEKSIAIHNKNNYQKSELVIHGERPVWLQAGNVFIALCSKDTEKTPEDVWNCIKNALVKWNPSFYRIITSELQNHIEEANLAMEKTLSISSFEQMAFLWGILQSPEQQKSRIARELLGNVAGEALEHILYKSDLVENVLETSKAINAPDYVSRDPKDEEPYRTFQNKILELSHTNTESEKKSDSETKYKIAHSFNEKLSTTKHFPTHITTGSILRDENDVWYVCVTPSCNTVPMQHTDQSSRDLKPHRQLTLAKLKKVDNVEDALKEAHLSSYIFVTSPEGEALAFSIVNLDSKLPNLIKVIILNHDDQEWKPEGHKAALTLKIEKREGETSRKLKEIQKKIYPISLLKPAYAARFQNIQSHYEGRIGVDFATLDISPTEQ